MATNNCPECQECCHEVCAADELECVFNCDCCPPMEIKLWPNQSLEFGTIMAQRKSDGLWGPFNPNADPAGSQDGVQIPKGLLRYSSVSDANGRISNFAGLLTAGCGPFTTTMRYQGVFRIQDIKGDLAAAMAYPAFARLLENFLPGPGLIKLV